MNYRDLEQLSDSFAEQFSERDENGVPTRIGRRLIQMLGIGPVCVALGYRDGYFARRFLDHVDARTLADTLGWSERFKRAWLRTNVPSARPFLYSEDVDARTRRLGPEEWRGFVEPFLGAKASPWGPGHPIPSVRIERLRLLYLVAEIVGSSRAEHGVFSYALATRPDLATSPLLAIAAEGVSAGEAILSDALHFAAGRRSAEDRNG